MPKTNEKLSPTTYLTPELLEDLEARLNRIAGHVRSVTRMLDDKDDCDSILVQLSAIKAALNQVTIKLLEGHMETCVSDCIRAGDQEALERLRRALAVVLKNS